MKLPRDTVMAREKPTKYLLVPQPRGDKSRFLRRGGYILENVETLERDLYALASMAEAIAGEIIEHGQYYIAFGEFAGPSGVSLKVKTIWMTEHLSDVTKFITLIPQKKRSG